MNKRIYADHNATGIVSPKHYDDVVAVLKTMDGNPSSPHARGRGAKVALESARNSVAAMLGARGQEIIFTSGATEANNIAIQGCLVRGKTLVVTSGVEHPSVAEPVRLGVERFGGEVRMVSVDASGVVSLDEIISACTDGKLLVTLILANNEAGSLTDVAAIAQKIREKNEATHIHVDAVQGLGKVDLSWVAASEIDTLSMSAHKLGAFKGTGALYVRGGTKLESIYVGGSQERNRRAGTENIPGIVSFGKRCLELQAGKPWSPSWVARARRAQEVLIAGLESAGCTIHGRPSEGLWNTVNFHKDGVAGDALLMNLDLSGIDASSGSACSTGVGRPSPVLKAMGYSDWVASNSVRLSFGYDFDEGVAAEVVGIVGEIIKKLEK